ncbi:MAG: hypothetical protein AB8C84_10095 [Oligoflexales bacterium]
MKEKVRIRKRQHSGRKSGPQQNRQSRDSPKQYKVLFYKSFQEAVTDSETIQATTLSCEQLNVVVEAEGDMDFQDILSLDPKVKLFAGKAWTHIHRERYEAGWYSSPRGLEQSFT